ncbi:MAG: cation transporter [bacterium]|nr:cation transporter [bacterium]
MGRKSTNCIEKDTGPRHAVEVRRITWIGLAVNLALSALKFVVGYLGASQAVIADAVHSLSDTATDFAVIFGVKFWSAPPDENHPYGHRRIEAMVTIAIGLSLTAVAAGIVFKALTSMRGAHIGQTGWVAILGPLLSIFFKEILFRWTIRTGMRVKSSALIANAWHHRSDAMSSIPALAAVAAAAIKPEWAFVDHVGALIVAIFILKVSWDIIRPSLVELTDGGASAGDRESIRKIAAGVNGVKEVHAVRTRKIGPGLYVDLHILVDPEMSVRVGHDISEEVRRELVEKGPDVLDVVPHLEPYEGAG